MMAEAKPHCAVDDADVAAHADALELSGAWSIRALYIPVFEENLDLARLVDAGIIGVVGGGRVDSGTELGRGVEDLVAVLDHEAVDAGEGLRYVLLVGVEVRGEVVDHFGQLGRRERSEVDDSAVGYEQIS